MTYVCLLFLFMIKRWIYFVIHPKNAIQSFKALYPTDGPEFILTQVCLVCPWVLHNGQITVLAFNNRLSIMFYLLNRRTNTEAA